LSTFVVVTEIKASWFWDWGSRIFTLLRRVLSLFSFFSWLLQLRSWPQLPHPEGETDLLRRITLPCSESLPW
jgi:hypothetical protein